MNENISRWLKQGAVYGFAASINKAGSLFLLPIYSAYLNEAEFGILELLIVTNALLIIVFQGGIGSAIMRTVSLREDFTQKTIISTSTIFVILSGLLGGYAIYFFSKPIAILLFEKPEFSTLIKLSAALLLPSLFIAVVTAYLRINEKASTFAIWQVFGFFIEVSSTLLFLNILHLGVKGIVLALLCKSWIVALCGITYIRNKLKFSFSLKAFGALMRFGLPLVLSGALFYILNLSDRFFLRIWSSLDQIGLYSIGYKIGLIIALLVNALQMAWPPIMYRLAMKEDGKNEFGNFTILYLAFFAFFSAFLSLFASELLWILTGGRYVAASRIVPLIALAYLFQGLFYMTNIGLNVKGRTEFEPLIVGAAAIINIILNILFIPHFGIVGAALATAIAYAALAIITERFSQHFFPLPQNYLKIAKILLLAISVIGISFFFNTKLGLQITLIKILTFFLATYAIYRLSDFSFKKQMKSIFNKIGI